MSAKQADEIKQHVRSSYAKVAEASNAGEASGCCGPESSCCGVSDDDAINTLVSTRLGYSEGDLSAVPKGADMGLGCGNPRAIAGLQRVKWCWIWARAVVLMPFWPRPRWVTAAMSLVST